MSKNNVGDFVRRSQNAGAPLLAINTSDPAQVEREIAAALPGAAISWDIATGAIPDTGAEDGSSEEPEGGWRASAAMQMAGIEQGPLPLQRILQCATQLPEQVLLILHMADRLLENPVVIQSVWNLRDLFKQDGRVLILVGASITLPPELRHDVLVYDHNLPSVAEVRGTLGALVERMKQDHPDMDGQPGYADDALDNAANILTGLSAFAVEQVASLAARATGFDPAEMWARKRSMIEQTPGITFDDSPYTFDDIGGMNAIKGLATSLMDGPAAPVVVAQVDEIEKAIAGASGASGDSSGVAQDQVGTILSSMEDYGWEGLILVGPPGCSKSMVTRAFGNTFGVPSIKVDLGAMKGSLVGKSEERVRSAMRVIRAMAGERCLWVATCNDLDSIPAALRRRFSYGIYYSGLPSEDDKARIWALNMARYEIAEQPLPSFERYTGADIRNCCRMAHALRCSLVDASKRIVPVAVSDAEGVARLEQLSEGRFLDANAGGIYRAGGQTQRNGKARKIASVGGGVGH